MLACGAAGFTNPGFVTEKLRIDKWLWAVRVYKTRTLAASACRAGQVRVNGEPAKASREVHPGDLIVARTEALTRTIRVTGLVAQRINAARVPEFLEDLTPPEELHKPRESAVFTAGWRPSGTGRPTKRDRRQMDAWLGEGGAD
ncbi:MAG: RNA-binding S4 domain-containing protein [Verrucomicrobiales bacterium]|nr:RNA-binding S4 domain-containing protein [Verrucomicrobiales bacterium]